MESLLLANTLCGVQLSQKKKKPWQSTPWNTRDKHKCLSLLKHRFFKFKKKVVTWSYGRRSRWTSLVALVILVIQKKKKTPCGYHTSPCYPQKTIHTVITLFVHHYCAWAISTVSKNKKQNIFIIKYIRRKQYMVVKSSYNPNVTIGMGWQQMPAWRTAGNGMCTE